MAESDNFDYIREAASSIAKRHNLRHKFYSMFEEKEDIGCWGGFYLTNGIINYWIYDYNIFRFSQHYMIFITKYKSQ